MFPKGTTTKRPEFSATFKQFSEMPAGMNFVGLSVLKPVLMQKQSGSYFVEPIATVLQEGDVRRSSDGSYNTMEDDFEEKTYATREMGIQGRVDQRILNAYQGNMDMAEAGTTQRLWRRIHTHIEKKLVAKLQDTGAISNSSVVDTWRDHANADPIADIIDGQSNIHTNFGQIPDTVVIGYKSLLELIQCDSVIDRIKFWGGDDPKAGSMFKNLQVLATNLNIKRLLVAGAVRNTANKGLPVSLSQFWDNDKILICHTAFDNPDPTAARIGITPPWDEDGGGIGEGEEPTFMVESWYNTDKRSFLYRVRCEADLDKALDNVKLGYIKTGAHAAP